MAGRESFRRRDARSLLWLLPLSLVVAAGCHGGEQLLRDAAALKQRGQLEASAETYARVTWESASIETRLEAARGQVSVRRQQLHASADATCPQDPAHEGVSWLGRGGSERPIADCWVALLSALDQQRALDPNVSEQFGLEAAQILVDHGHFEEALARLTPLDGDEARALQIEALWLLGDWRRWHAQVERWRVLGAFEEDTALRDLISARTHDLCDAFARRSAFTEASTCFEEAPALRGVEARLEALERAASLRADTEEITAREVSALGRARNLRAHSPRIWWRWCALLQEQGDAAASGACWSSFIRANSAAEHGETLALVLEARIVQARATHDTGAIARARIAAKQLRTPGAETDAWWLAIERDGMRARVDTARAQLQLLEAEGLREQIKRLPLTRAPIGDVDHLRERLRGVVRALEPALGLYADIARTHRDESLGLEALERASLTLHEVALWFTTALSSASLPEQARQEVDWALVQAVNALEHSALELYRRAADQVMSTPDLNAGQWMALRQLAHEAAPHEWPALIPEALLWRWPETRWSMASWARIQPEATPRIKGRLMTRVRRSPSSTADSEDAQHQAAAHHMLGVISMQRRDVRTARGEFERALELNPTASHAHLDLGLLFLEGDDAMQAAHHLDAALEHALDQRSRARAHLALGLMRYDEARHQIAATPAIWRPSAELSQSFPLVARYLGASPNAQRAGEGVTPEPLRRPALRLALEPALEHFYLASGAFPLLAGAQIALIHRDLGHTHQASERCEALLFEASTPPLEVLHSCALVALSSGDIAQAHHRLDALIQRAPDDARARRDLGWILLQLDPRRADEVLTHPALAGDPDALFERAEAAWRNGRPDEAEALLAQAPEGPERRYQRAIFFSAQRRRAEAREEARRFLDDPATRGASPSQRRHLQMILESPLR